MGEGALQTLQRLGLEPRSRLALRFGLVTGHSKTASSLLGEDAGRMERSGAWKEEEGRGGVRAGMRAGRWAGRRLLWAACAGRRLLWAACGFHRLAAPPGTGGSLGQMTPCC